jgi:hypothetical protein
MADSINNNAVDGMGRSYSGIDLNMLKSLMSGKVGDEKPFNSKGTDEIKEEIAKLAKLLASKNAQFAKDIQKAVSYINEMKNVLSSVNKNLSSKESGSNFTDMANALGKILNPLVKKDATSTSSDSIRKAILTSNSELKIGFKSMEKASNLLGNLFHEFIKLMEPLVDEGLKKGSIYTRDERLAKKIGKGVKLEPGTIKKVTAGIMVGDNVSKEFKEALESMGLEDRIQEISSGALKQAGNLADAGMSEQKALLKAFEEYGQSAGLTKKEMNQFLAARTEIFDAAQVISERRKKAEESTSIGAHFSSFEKGATTIKKVVDYIGPALTSFAKEMANVDFSLSGIVQKTKDQYKAQLDFQRSLYQTMGTAGNLAESQAALNDLSYSYAETGVETVEAYKMASKYQKAGLKLEKDTSRVIKGQLATEKQIGLEAGSLGDYFMDMKQSAGMSGIEVRQLGLDMSNVAKSSGLSGEAMKSVVDKSKELAKQLQSMGTLTVDANKNSLSILAEAKKLGVDDQSAELLKGMGGMNAMMKSQHRTLIANAADASGTMADIMAGTIMDDPEKLKKFGDGLKAVNENILNNDIEAKYKVRSYADLKALAISARTDENAKQALMKINLAAQQQGTTAEAMLKLPETFEKGTRTTQEKLAELNADHTKTIEQKTKLKNQIEESAQSSLIAKLSETVNYSKGNLDDALANFKIAGGKELEGMGADAGGLLSKSLEATNARLAAAGEKPLALDQKALDKALASGKKGELQEVIATLQEGQSKAAAAEQAMNNPVDRSARSLKTIEDTIVGWGTGILGSISGALVKLGAIVPLVGTILTTIIAIKAMAKAKEVAANLSTASSMTPAPPPRLSGPTSGPAPAPPPNLPGPAPVPAPPPNTGETKGKDVVVSPKEKAKVDNVVVSPKEKAKVDDATSKPKGKAGAKAVAAGGKDVSPAGKKPVVPKGKAVSAKPKGKLGAIMSGGSAMAGGLAETAMSVIGGGEDEGCACSVAESALSKVSGIAGIATDAAMTAADVALDTTKKTGKAVANVADDAAKGAAKGAAKATAKGITSSVDDAAIAVTKSAGAMSSATGFMGKSLGVLGKVAGPLVSVAGAGIEIAAGGDVTEAISGGAGGLIGGALLGTVGTFIGGPIGTAVGGAIGAYAGDWLGRIGSEYLPGVWEGVKDVSSSIWEGTKDVASSLWDSAGTVAGGIADGAVSLAKGIDDFTGGRISAATDAIGGVASDVAGWTGDKISGAASAVGNAASAVGSAASAGWSSFTGWLGFAEGAREIDNNGLAMLHKGEVIFPKSIVESLVAKGTSSFGSLGGYLQDVGGGLASAASKFVESGGVGGLLGSAVTNLGSSLAGYAGSIFGSPSKMQGEMATAELANGSNKASSLATAGSAALSNIAAATESQNSISSEIKGVLKDILQEMIKSNNGDGGGSGETYAGMSSSRDAFKSPIGNINDVAVKNVTQEAYG